MQIIFDIAKRDITLLKRGLDFGDAGLVFAGRHLTSEDCRQDYGETRYITIGVLSERYGGIGLDAARRGSPYHFHEKSQ